MFELCWIGADSIRQQRTPNCASWQQWVSSGGRVSRWRAARAAALERAPATPGKARATALYWQAMFERNFGDPVLAREFAKQSAAESRQIDYLYGLIKGLYALALVTSDDDAPSRTTGH